MIKIKKVSDFIKRGYFLALKIPFKEKIKKTAASVLFILRINILQIIIS